MNKTLVREPYVADNRLHGSGMTEQELVVLREAASVIGYTSGFTSEKQKKPIVTKQELVERLFEMLGVEPFTAESVSRYKKQKVRWLNKWATLLEFLDSKTFGACLFCFAAVGFLALLVEMAAWILVGHVPSWERHWWVWTVPTFSVSSFVTLVALLPSYIKIRKYAWVKTWLDAYKEPIPLFALSLATQVIELLPEAQFQVDSLVCEERVLDPFLVMKYRDQLFYLDVWDEPRFEGRRTK